MDMKEHIQQQNATLFQYLITTLREEFGDDLLGILATGSRVHGTPSITSDLDAHVVIAQPRRQRRNLVVDGVELELFINPPFQIRRYFADKRGVDPHMFTFGQVIYDPRGVMAELRDEARRIWDAGPEPIEEHARWIPRYFTADLLRDAEDIADDPAAATLVLALLVERLLETHACIRGRWHAKPKRLLADTEQWDAEAANLARTALAGATGEGRLAAARRLAEYVLEPIGGLMPLAWQTEWETLES